MAGHRKYTELEGRMPRDARERARRKAEIMLAALDLDELVRARGVTQEELADRLGTQQPNVSRTLRRADMHVSTLRNVVEALDGTLELIARFPDGDVRLTQFETTS
jgi:hypothetical protein